MVYWIEFLFKGAECEQSDVNHLFWHVISSYSISTVARYEQYTSVGHLGKIYCSLVFYFEIMSSSRVFLMSFLADFGVPFLALWMTRWFVISKRSVRVKSFKLSDTVILIRVFFFNFFSFSAGPSSQRGRIPANLEGSIETAQCKRTQFILRQSQFQPPPPAITQSSRCPIESNQFAIHAKITARPYSPAHQFCIQRPPSSEQSASHKGRISTRPQLNHPR